MRTAGITLVFFGALSTLGSLISLANGRNGSLGGLVFVVLGAFLVSRAIKKKEEEQKKKEWEESSDKEEEM